MNPIRYTLKELKEKTVPIGREGENEYTVVSIDCAEVYEEYPAAVASMKVQNPNKVIYPVVIERSGNDIIWTVKASDLTVKGDGRFQLTFTEGTVIHKTVIGRTLILKSLVGDGPVPEAVEDWIDEATELMEDMEEKRDSGYFKGDPGEPGEPGAPGHSPVLTADKVGKTTTIYSDGTQLAQILDGQDGQAGAIIDDTAPAADKVFSSSKVNGELNTVKSAIQNIDNLFTETESENKFDKTGVTSDKYFNVKWDGTYLGIANDTSMNIEYVPIDGDGTYTALVAYNHFGVNAKFIPLFNESRENVAVVTGTLTNNICVLAITAEHISNGAKYIGYSIRDDDLNIAMLVKASEYPSEYIPYFKEEVFNGATKAENIIGLSDAVNPLLAPITRNLLADEEQLTNLSENFYEDIGENLFDKNNVILNKYFSINGSGVYQRIASDTDMCLTYVPIKEAGIYTAKVEYSFFGTTAKFIPLFDRTKENVSVITGTLDNQDSNICSFTIQNTDINNGAVYIGLSVRKINRDTEMLVKASTYPSEYIPYVNNGSVFTGKVERENVIDLLVKREKSVNLFNNRETIFGKYFSINGNGVYSGIADSGNASIAYVPINGAGNYTMKNAKQIYGTYIIKFVALFNSSKVNLSVVTGTIDSSDNSITHFTITETDINNGAYYIGYTVHTTDIGMAMLVKSSTYPSEYIPYYEEHTELKEDIKLHTGLNPLYGKTVVFDGDSICQDGQCGGWAKLIGNANEMVWKNAGIAGGTITAGTYSGSTPLHWVCRSIDDIHDEFESLDYLILEGGTNDADRLTDEQIGAVDPANFSTFDDETFVGALESLFYKATSYYHTAKIGFIIAHRMGYASGARYDAADSPSHRRRRKFFETAIEVCQKWGIPYIDLWESSPLCPMLECYYDSTMTGAENTEAGKAYTDGQHLTPVGYSIITPKIEAWMKTL